MAQAKPEFVRSLPADAALAAFIVVAASAATAGNVKQCTASTTPLGVTLEASNAGQQATFAMGGILKVVAGGAITAGDDLGVDASGRAVSITISAAGTTKRPTIGVAHSAAANAGEYVYVFFQPGYAQT